MTSTPEAKPPRTAADKADRSRLIGGIVIAIVAIWFILANTHRTSITFWFVTVTSPMWLTLAGTFLAGMLATLLFTRRRRDK
jgi:LPXTG-motif cell wall-anchored protein